MASSSVPATPLLYSCIAYKNTILAEHTVSAASGTSSLASVILPKIKHTSPEKLTYTHNANLIHYIADAGSASANTDSLNAPNLTYLVVAKGDLGRRVPFGFLVEIKKRFLKAYNPENTDFSSLPAYGAAAYNAQLKSLMVEYGTTKSGQEDAFKNVQGEIDNVRGIMTENIERVLERGERLDLLVDKTDRLGGSARDFRVRSRGLKRRMWWKNVKLMVMLGLVIVFLLYLMVGMGCGLPGKLCPILTIIRYSTNTINSMVSLRSPRLKIG
jgi:vesicle-associated membrane protein 7